MADIVKNVVERIHFDHSVSVDMLLEISKWSKPNITSPVYRKIHLWDLLQRVNGKYYGLTKDEYDEYVDQMKCDGPCVWICTKGAEPGEMFEAETRLVVGASKSICYRKIMLNTMIVYSLISKASK
jgi:hypothetical protein